MLKPDELLERAQKAFTQKRFDTALKLYAQVLAAFPRLRDARVGAMLCDVAMTQPAEAAALFDFYQLIKTTAGAEKLIEEIADAVIALNDVRIRPEAVIESADGISYADFIALAENNGNFRETFEDILFSTKVVITSKAEFIDFVTRLAQEGMVETALKYLDASSGVFGNDQEVLALYGIVEEKRS